MPCSFDFPIPQVRVPGFSLPAPPKIPNFFALIQLHRDLGLPGKPEIPLPQIRVPGFALPAPPKITKFQINVDLPGPPPLPPLPQQRVPGFGLPSPPKLPSLKITCPFD